MYAYDGGSLETAAKVLRLNYEGLAGTDKGVNGRYNVAITTDGHVNASMVTFGEMDGNLIKAKSLQIGSFDEATENTITSSLSEAVTEWYVSTSPTELKGGTWSENRPAWTNSNYIWQRLRTTNKKGEVSYSEPSCVQGNDGSSGDDAILLYIDSSNGTTFKNSSVATIFTVSIYVGGNVIDNSTALKKTFGDQAHLRWLIKRYGETEFSEIPSNDSRLNDEGFIFTLSAKDIRFKAVFNCELNI